jgi:hypothetical protein
MTFVEQAVDANPTIHTDELVQMIEKKFGIVVHRRSLERARTRRGKSA